MPTYLKYKYIFFFISISGRIRIRIFFSAEPDPDPWKKIPDPHPCFNIYLYSLKYDLWRIDGIVYLKLVFCNVLRVQYENTDFF